MVLPGAEVEIAHANTAVGLQAFLLLLRLGVIIVSASLTFEEVALGNGLVVYISLLGIGCLATLGHLFSLRWLRLV